MSTVLEDSSPGPPSGNASVEAGAMTFVDVQLPSGRHGLPPEFVDAHQRQRLLRAICDLCAKSGYGSTTIAEIAREAGVSRRTFYKHYTCKQECFVVAYEMSLARLEKQIAKACVAAGADWHDRVAAGLRVLLEELARDRSMTHVLFVDVLSAGPAALLCRQEALRRHCARIPVPPGVPAGVAETVAGSVVEMIYDTVLEGRLSELPTIYGELLYCVLVPFLGPAEATAVCGRVSALTNSSS